MDVDDPDTREIVSITQTLPTAGKESFNLVVLRSPEVLNIIQGLAIRRANSGDRCAETGARGNRNQRALNEPVGKDDQFESIQRWFKSSALASSHHHLRDVDLARASPRMPAATTEIAIGSSLEGDPITLRRSLPKHEVIMAAHPIVVATR